MDTELVDSERRLKIRQNEVTEKQNTNIYKNLNKFEKDLISLKKETEDDKFKELDKLVKHMSSFSGSALSVDTATFRELIEKLNTVQLHVTALRTEVGNTQNSLHGLKNNVRNFAHITNSDERKGETTQRQSHRTAIQKAEEDANNARDEGTGT